MRIAGSRCGSVWPSPTRRGIKIRQGDKFWVDFGTPLGSEPGYIRPAVVVQSNVFNASPIDTVVVCATTTTADRADDPGNVELDEGDADLPEASVVKRRW